MPATWSNVTFDCSFVCSLARALPKLSTLPVPPAERNCRASSHQRMTTIEQHRQKLDQEQLHELAAGVLVVVHLLGVSVGIVFGQGLGDVLDFQSRIGTVYSSACPARSGPR